MFIAAVMAVAAAIGGVMTVRNVVAAFTDVGTGNVAAVVAVVVAIAPSLSTVVDAGNLARRLRRIAGRTRVAAPLAVAVWINGRSRSWQAEDWRAALTESPRPSRYGLGLVAAAVQMRLYDLGGLLVRSARWVLASNRRTWWPLGPLLVFAAVNVHRSQGWGSAFYTLPTIIGFHIGVEWLRHRWEITVKPRRSTEDPDGEQTDRA
ncbi:hypothetical protein [Streptosporangium saharense]|uniref:Type IV secretory pathway VirB2 component (Pilin) n=1 Tax=Streptosporangium saharense TaxID=1706840 RepID=A0A7W7QPD0_9ACTN|nr:hypothetical protein [Streptosporangium saharense]MBB4917335.1 type IV secretory pathway VirB2 component (pilin) [Streptosporangium saharense]